jgi:hypothetical protein
MLAEGRLIDATTAWTIIVTEGVAIGGMAGYIVHQQRKHDRKEAAMLALHEKKVTEMQAQHDKKVTEMGQKINEQYDKRIEDMKETLDLVATLERVVNRERKGGK